MRYFSPRSMGGRSSLAQAMRNLISQGKSLPPPVEGWDAISPIAAMPPKRAVTLDNWFPQPEWVEVRRGHSRYAFLEISNPVETLACYQGASSTKLFAAADGSIFDVTSGGNVVTADVTGLANARFQFINFSTTGGHFLQLVNGVDAPQYYDGSAWHVATITGSAGAAIGINAHKNRIWYIPQNSTKPEYLPVDSFQGAVTGFELGGLMTLGGYVMAMGTWSIDAGDGPDDYAVFVTSRGQVIIYSGTNPASANTWTLVGVFNMGAPIGRRCLTRVGADVAIICIDGVVPLSKAMIFERAAVVKVTLTHNIQRVMNQSARSYGDNFGWQLISYPRGTRAILNVPITENEEQQQYVMNTLTGAWCRFTGDNANCWELMNDRLFFGGNDGRVYEGDTSGTITGGTLECNMLTAFNYYGTSGLNKRWTMCQPLITTDRAVTPSIAFNVDFRTNATLTTQSAVASVGALWDVAEWDVDVWGGEIVTQTDWISVSGVGKSASIRMAVDIVGPDSGLAAIWGVGLWGVNTWGEQDGDEITLQVNGFNVTYETGAFI